jgi:soluble lytic murein transglycosylase-like protein
MALRLVTLFVVGVVACFAAVASARTTHVLTVSRIPAIPAKAEAAAGRCPIPKRFRTAFVRAARDSGLQLSMLVAVAQVESEFRPNARSRADARGLLQVMPSTAAELKLNVDVPSSNVLAGARYLKLMIARYPRTDLALAAYNAGPTAVDRAGGAPNGQAISYIANVQQRWSALAGCS